MESIVFDYIRREEQRQRENIELIASENFASENVRRAMSSCLTNKYCEGYAAKRSDGVGRKGRYYGGCQVIDDLEEYCCQKWREVYKTDYHVNVQPHSGSQANQAAYFSVLQPGDKVLAMDLQNGGHLTHGSAVNFSGRIYDFHFYGVDAQGFIDYEDLEEKARSLRPQLILAGASAYSRIIDFERIAAVAREVGAYFMVDIAHIAGLIAAGEHPSPFGLADIITSTTHKTLRGPRGGLIFCRPELAGKIDGGVFPGTQGGPLEHVIAAKAIAAEEALTPEYKAYAHAIVVNTAAMCREFQRLGYDIVTGGTDNHLFLIDLSRSHPDITGKDVQEWLDKHHITVNKNCVPGDRRSTSLTSGIRIGTAAETTRGRTAEDFVAIADRIDALIRELRDSKAE
ncbi:MAG: serine hydroxymethyltransferase [Oscillospiraceae bacterium]|nr:serine hydroxymethyltransferase [Oscillospiraceae bacterium]